MFILLQEIRAHYDIPVMAIASDNAANISAAIEKVMALPHVRCVAHTLQLSIKGHFEHHFGPLRKKLHDIITHFSHSTKVIFQHYHYIAHYNTTINCSGQY